MLAFSLLLTMVNVGLRAQSGIAGAITGTVVDQGGAVIRDAEVTLTFTSSSAKRSVSTGAEGKFLFLQLNTGEYSLNVDAPGFATSRQRLTYLGVPIHLSIALSAAGLTTDVMVTATTDDPTEPAHVNITPEQIDRMPTESASSPFSSLITMTTPGAAADSNGSFHPLGDHAEASFVIDGQPITDQQSRTFSSQVSLNALQSVEVREGAPGADVGDKTSMVIVAQTRSGLDQRTPHGSVAFSQGSFATSMASANLGFGSPKFGSFTAIDALNSGRFLDTPETEALHANGNAENVIERFDRKTSDKTSLQVNTSFSRSWFQTPNTFDQQARRRTNGKQ